MPSLIITARRNPLLCHKTTFSSHSHSQPTITFHGPGSNQEVTTLNPTGLEVARFIAQGKKSHFFISRLTGPSTPPVNICTGSRSSWSEDTKLSVHGTELNMKWDTLLGEQAHVRMPGPMGKLEWREDSGLSSLSKYKLVDSSKRVVARASTKERRCEVLVPEDEMLFDSVLSLWIAYLLYHKGDALADGGGGGMDDAEELKATMKIFEAVGNVAGAGGC